jgi:hypothetical protein
MAKKPAGSNGGKRPGAGRPPGAVNKKTKALVEKCEAEGLMPLEYMLQLLRDETLPASARFGAAVQAAPYLHAKLSAVDHTSNSETINQIVEHILPPAPDADKE